MQRSDGGVVDMELLRPRWWLGENNLVAGSSVDIHIEELQVSGLAQIQSVEESPTIVEGDGSVVTALFKTRVASELVTITLEDGTSLTGTPVHPVWSLDRSDWVALGDLQEGESLSAESGPIVIASVELLSSAVPVYNFETHGEHVYQVTHLGLLVHNACPTVATQLHHAWPKYLGGAAKQSLVPLKVGLHKAYHKGLDKLLPRAWGTAYYNSLSKAQKLANLKLLAKYTKQFDKIHGTNLFKAMRANGLPKLR